MLAGSQMPVECQGECRCSDSGEDGVRYATSHHIPVSQNPHKSIHIIDVKSEKAIDKKRQKTVDGWILFWQWTIWRRKRLLLEMSWILSRRATFQSLQGCLRTVVVILIDCCDTVVLSWVLLYNIHSIVLTGTGWQLETFYSERKLQIEQKFKF